MRIGLDIGGTKTDAVAVDASRRIVARTRLATGWGPDAVVRTIVEAVDALGVAGVRSVGIGIPGQVAPGTARVVHAVNLGIDDLDLAAAVGPLLDVPIAVENDVKAAALGAAALHGGSGTMAYLNLGTGVAAGVVAGGAVWRGARGAAGEIGHVSVDPAGPACRCGQHGCIEALAGGGAVALRWGRGGALPVRDVFDAADAGDAEARALREGIARGVSAAIRLLVLTVDADVVMLGGGLTGLGARLRDDATAELAVACDRSPFLRSLRLEDRVEMLPAGSPAGALGAALAAVPREVLLG